MRLNWTRKRDGLETVASSRNDRFRIRRGPDNDYELLLNDQAMLRAHSEDELKEHAERML